MTPQGAGADIEADLELELLDLASRAARIGGAELLARWRGPLEVQSKSSATDPVSDADLASQTAILDLLLGERPGDSVLAEEAGASDDAPWSGEFRWVVDPLDATVNYLYGLYPFVVSVAAEDADGAVVGVVYDPVRDESYLATRSGPALYYPVGDSEGVVLIPSTCDQISRALVATGFSYDQRVRAAQGRTIAHVLPRARDIRRAGAAALDLCLTAGGHVDAYYEHGVKPWDIAAGALICRRAGVAVVELPATDELPGGILAGPAALLDELLALVAGVQPGG